MHEIKGSQDSNIKSALQYTLDAGDKISLATNSIQSAAAVHFAPDPQVRMFEGFGGYKQRQSESKRLNKKSAVAQSSHSLVKMIDEDALIAEIIDQKRLTENRTVRQPGFNNYRKQVERELLGKYEDKKFLPRGSTNNLISRSMAGNGSIRILPTNSINL